MELGINGKRVLITGASRGLGRAIAIRLANEGAMVATVARNRDGILQIIQEIGGSEHGHYGIYLDLMNHNSGQILYDNIIKNFGEIDIIIHNLGGTLDVKEPLGTVEDFQKVWLLNIGISIELNRLFIPKMQEKKWGRVVHISSSSAVMADASLAYSSAKAAVNNYVKGLAQRLAKDGVIVSAVMPGPFIYNGSHWDNVAKNEPERYNKFISEKMSVGRLGKPEEITAVIALLCSEWATFCAGAVVPVDGGIH